MCDRTGQHAICDRRITEVLNLLQAPGSDRSLWAVVFCPKIASAAIGFLLHHHVSRENLGVTFASMAPGQLLPQLLVHLGLFQVMYCQSPQVWETTSRLLLHALEDWMDALIRDRVLVRRVDLATNLMYWERDHNVEVQWRNNPDSLLGWVDTTLFSTANLDLGNISEERRSTRIEQIPHLLGDLDAIPEDARQQTPTQVRLIAELDRLLQYDPDRPRESSGAAASRSTSSDAPPSVGHGTMQHVASNPAADAVVDAGLAHCFARWSGHQKRAAKYHERMVMSIGLQGRVSIANELQDTLLAPQRRRA